MVGAGRIGRVFLREWQRNPRQFRLAGVVDTADPRKLAALTEFDTSYGRSLRPVRYVDGAFDLGEGLRVPFFRPEEANYEEIGATLVVEATGRASRREPAEAHLQLGARQVLVTMPPKTREDADAVLLHHVNHTDFDPRRHRILSAASCTTNCLVHPVMALREAGMRIAAGFFVAIHAVTNSQRLVDAPAEDLPDSWSAFQNIIISETGAAKAIAMIFPDLEGKITGQAARVPTLTGSLLEAHFQLEQSISREELRAALRTYAAGREEAYGLTTDAHLPSRAFVGDPRASIVVEPSLEVRGNLARVVAWYDNEMGYTHRLLGLCRHILSHQGD